MSGRVKHPVTDAEQLRQLTREAHEAIQGLAEARRELRAERDQALAAIRDALQEVLASAGEVLSKSGTAVLDLIQDQAAVVIDHIAVMLGAENGGQLADQIVRQCASDLGQFLTLEVTSDNHVQIVRRDQPSASVFVTNDPANAPPGSFVIDARPSSAVSRELKRGPDL